MDKSGRVLNFDDEKVYIVTTDKEFATVTRNSTMPVKGKLYTGRTFIDYSKPIKLLSIIISICITALIIINVVFFTSRASIVIELNTNIRIDMNRNKIVKVDGIGINSIDIVQSTPIKGTNLNDGLIVLFDNALKQKLIPTLSAYDRGTIYIYVTKGKRKEPLNFTKFTQYADEHNYDVIVNRNDNKIPSE